MELMLLIFNSLSILAGVYFGYQMGQGNKIDLVPRKMKKVLRDEAQEAKLEAKMWSK